jgi:hypothetical protein
MIKKNVRHIWGLILIVILKNLTSLAGKGVAGGFDKELMRGSHSDIRRIISSLAKDRDDEFTDLI